MVDRHRRGMFLTVMAVLFAVLAVSDLTKALQHLLDPEHLGVVIFGVRFESPLANLVLGATVATLLASYSYSLWRLHPMIVPLSIGYAFYVPTNLVLFWFRQTGDPQVSVVFILLYLAVALPGSIGTALYIAYHRDELL